MNSTENCLGKSSSSLVPADKIQNQNNQLANSGPQLPPQFFTSLVDLDVIAGSNAKFVVQICSSTPQSLKVSWYQNGFPVLSSDRHLFLHEGDFHCVQINQVSPKDAGQWTCRAENQAGGMSCCCVLHVTCPPVFRPPEFISGLRGCLWDNGTISLECEVRGKPTPSLRWYKDGSQILEGASLTIKASTREPETLIGIFACEAQNCMGKRTLYSKVYAKNFCDYLNGFSQQKQIQQTDRKV